MKKILTIALIAVLVVCALLLVACNKEEKKEETTTTAAQTTAAKTTKAQTTAELTTEEVTTEAVTTAFPAELEAVMPASLPDGSKYTVAIRVDLNNAEDYTVKGNAKDAGNFGFDADGIYGKALWVGRAPEGKSPRAEIEVEPTEYAFEIGGCAGILWYVDFSNTLPAAEYPDGACCSITMDTNTYRSNKSGNMSVGYYFADGAWVETHNVNACRMQVPAGFKGWMYVPATSYVATADASAISGEDGNFLDMTTYTFRCYTDRYDQTVGLTPDFKVIFDEIMWVKKAV